MDDDRVFGLTTENSTPCVDADGKPELNVKGVPLHTVRVQMGGGITGASGVYRVPQSEVAKLREAGGVDTWVQDIDGQTMAIKLGDAIYIPMNDSVEVSAIIAIIQANLTDSGREKLIGEMRSVMCISCGRLDPSCQCWNDE